MGELPLANPSSLAPLFRKWGMERYGRRHTTDKC
jgi:hypothetical protein